ncbi:MAG: sigma-54 dependent transcriptional regulator [bacterium]|nr:sigma-54 dependent transcriptional regulator [bacterium]
MDLESGTARLLPHRTASATSGLEELPILIGRSDALKAVRTLIEQVAPMDVPVLISGESGTGKEVVARLLHLQSHRKQGAFVPVNCGAIPEGLFESEMFGAVRGAYTGSERNRAGLFEQAHKGTLLLDEIGEMPMTMQVKLLRVLETGEVTRVGGNDSMKVDFRLVSSTNRDLAFETSHEKFRHDLYYRIRAVQIELPPLRERPEDIPPLIDMFTAQFMKRNRTPPVEWSSSALHWLSDQRWEGNVRELRWFIEGYLSLDRSGGMVTVERVQPFFAKLVPTSKRLPVLVSRSNDSYPSEPGYDAELNASPIRMELQELKREVRELKGMVATALLRQEESRIAKAPPPTEIPFFPTVKEREEDAIRDALRFANGNRRDAAMRLGISERTLYRKLRQLNLHVH